MRAPFFSSPVRGITRMGFWGFLLWGMAQAFGAGPFRLAPEQPTLDRWNYPFNFQPADRPVALPVTAAATAPRRACAAPPRRETADRS